MGGVLIVKSERRSLAGVWCAAVLAAFILPQVAQAETTPGQGTDPERADIIRHLNAAITWYNQLMRANEGAGQPSDAFYLESARNQAKEALQLAFESAQAEADLFLAEKGGQVVEGTEGSSTGSANQEAVAKSVAATSALIDQIQKQIESLSTQIARSSGKKRKDLTSRREILQEQLDFNKALQDQLQKLAMFMTGSAAAAGGFQKEIENLKNSVPDVFAKAAAKPATPAAQTAAPETTGLIGGMENLFTRIGDLRDVNGLISGAQGVIDRAHDVQAPLRTRIRNTIAEGRALATEAPPTDAAGIEANRRKISFLTAQFKQTSNAAIPLSQEIVMLEQSQASLRQWESSINRGYLRNLWSVLIRLALLLIGIGLVLGLSEVWRRATYRYVREPRRRHQVLLLRRIVTFFLMALVLALGLISEFSSLATFAGFITAGIAVALQTLILSIAAYFFLIGRHGVRVGDRITVSGVTGDVIEVGIVRLYLMELAGTGADLHPSGRVVTVSNSVLLQGTPFFKQIPGTAYTWREVAVKLERDSDYATAEDKLLDAVNSVYSGYRNTLEQQHESLTGLGAVPFQVPTPQARLQLVENALELVIRYPVLLQRESEIDNQMARKILDVINNDPELKAGVGAPNIREVAKA